MDDAGDPTADAGDSEEPAESSPDRSPDTVDDTQADSDRSDGRREVAVPEEVFRVVVVFSTMLSILSVLVGFVLLDAATRISDNPAGSIVVGVVSWVTATPVDGLSPHFDTIALAVGLLGIGAIGLGVWIYAIGTRFRTEMGKPKEQADEDSGNG